MNQEHYVITIGRQMGSGGASMGKALAKHPHVCWIFQ